VRNPILSVGSSTEAKQLRSELSETAGEKAIPIHYSANASGIPLKFSTIRPCRTAAV
jgi:hypothetical protein